MKDTLDSNFISLRKKTSVLDMDFDEKLEHESTYLLLFDKTYFLKRILKTESTCLFISFDMFFQTYSQWIIDSELSSKLSGFEYCILPQLKSSIHTKSLIYTGLELFSEEPKLVFPPKEDLQYHLPDEKAVKEVTHIVCNKPIYLNFEYLYHYPVANCEVSNFLCQQLCRSYSFCLSNEIYNTNHIGVKGIKHDDFLIFDENENVNIDTIKAIEEAVNWVYQTNPETRLQLIASRICLEKPNDEVSFVSLLGMAISAALSQAKSQYSFVISERQDAYNSELKSILKDMQNHVSLISQKVRDLVTSFKRDLLIIAALPIAKYSAGLGLSDSGHQILATYIIMYLCLSLSLQIFTSVRDLNLTKSEINSWLKLSIQYIQSTEIEDIVKKSLHPRQRFFTYSAIAFISIYILLILAILWFVPNTIGFIKSTFLLHLPCWSSILIFLIILGLVGKAIYSLIKI